MEGQYLLDVPITDEEHRQRNSDYTSLLSSPDISEDAHKDESDTHLQRFGSLTNAVQRVNDLDDVNESPIVHRTISLDSGQPQRPFNFTQSTSYDRQTTYTPLVYPPDLWRSFWIRKSTLIVLLSFFLLTTVALVLLWHYSKSLNGFNVGSSTSHYAWTYAPVAFMVVVFGVWRQVDYYLKLIAPWDELRKGPVPASNSLLLDYVSPLHIVSLLTAFKRGYIPVILSILVLFLLKVNIIFVGALFIKLPTTVVSNTTSASSTKAFDASSINWTSIFDVSSFTSDPVYSTLGNIAFGLPYAAGVVANYTYIPVSLDSDADDDLQNATYTATTEAFVPNLSCAPILVTVYEKASIASADEATVNNTNNYIPLQLPDGSVCGRWAQPTVYAMNPQRQRTPSRQIQGTMQRVYCAGENETEGQLLEPAGLLFTVTDIRYTQEILDDGTIVDSTRTVAALSNMLCIPGYSIFDATVSNSSALYGANVNAVDARVTTIGNKSLGGLSNQNLAVLYEGIANASQGVFGARQEDSQALNVPNTIFDLMALTTNQTGLEPYLNTTLMQIPAENVFRRIISHYAASILTKSTQANLTAFTISERDKLHVNLVPFCIVTACAALSALCTAILVISAPGPVVPKDPSVIAMSATMLARSPQLNRLLQGQASSNLDLASALDGHEFGTAIATTETGQNSFQIVVSEAVASSQLPNKKASEKWWSPHIVLLPAVSIAIVAPLALIAVLAVLQHRSNAHEGLATVNNNDRTALYTRCIPVLVMLLIGGAVELLNFYVELLSPWNKLNSGNIPANRSILSHTLGKLPPLAFLHAMKRRQLGAVFSISAAALASVFATIAAGLYTVEDMSSAGPLGTLTAADTIRLQSPYSVFDDRGAAGMLGLIDKKNTPYPDGLFENLVFSDYLQPETQNRSFISQYPTSSPYSAVVTAFRPNLQCTPVSNANISLTFEPATLAYPTDHYIVNSQFALPESCHLGGAGNSSTSSFQNVFNSTGRTTVYGGQLLDLVFGQNSSSVNHYGERDAAAVDNNPPVGCPSLAFTFIEINEDSDQYQVTPLVCYQQVEQLQANVTYKTNSTQLDPTRKPVIIESTIKLVPNSNSTVNAYSYDFRIQSNVERQLYGLNGMRLESNNSTISYEFDAFFSYLFNNTYQQDPNTLAGSSNQQTLIQAVNTLYSQYMALAITGNMRVSLPSASNSTHSKRQSSPSTVTARGSTTRSRLIQNRRSTLTLQILLGLSSLLSILAYILTKFHHLLPHNPSSIAGTMSLLAGSNLCTADDEICECCGKPRQNSLTPDLNQHAPVVNSDDTISLASRHQHSPNQTVPHYHERIIPPNTGWSDHIDFAATFAKRKYSLGWWHEAGEKSNHRRFGIDTGTAGVHPDSVTDQDPEPGHQSPPVVYRNFEDFMLRGRGRPADNRGAYHVANRAELSPDLGLRSAPGSRSRLVVGGGGGRQSSPTLGLQTTITSSSTFGTPPLESISSRVDIRSPRRVRFQDERD